MLIKRNNSVQPTKGSAETFSGEVLVESLVEAASPARVRIAKVTFSPGAHSNWHRHPLGQTLIVVSGTGWVQSEGGQKEEIHVGDVVWCLPGEKHWHGATPNSSMTHYAIQEAEDGKIIEWLEQVSEEEYKLTYNNPS